MKKTWPTLLHLSPYLALALLLFVPSSHAGKRPTLTTEQVILQVEAQYDGRVSSVSQAGNSPIYQVRLLNRAGKVLLITVDAHTGKMHETQPTTLQSTPAQPQPSNSITIQRPPQQSLR